MGVSLLAATSQSKAHALEVSADLGFPVAYGVERSTGDAVGAWWEDRKDHIQPTEFILNQKGRVVSSTYSSSPVGRMDPEETLFLTKMLAARSAKREIAETDSGQGGKG